MALPGKTPYWRQTKVDIIISTNLGYYRSSVTIFGRMQYHMAKITDLKIF